MTYLFKLPNAMRGFTPVRPGARLLYRTDFVHSAEEILRISGIAIMSYDHRDKLALEQEEGGKYLLIEEIDDEIRELAYAWTQKYEESHDERIALEAVRDRLTSLLRKYIRAELPPHVAFDEKGPGVHLILHPLNSL
jgi:hypothetical protein